MPEHGAYAVQGNVVEHTTDPRFQAIVSIHDGQSAGIRMVEWVDRHKHLTDAHLHFMLATALLAWSLANPQATQ